MPTAVVPIDAMPDAPDRADRANLSRKSTAAFTALKDAFVPQTNALGNATFLNAQDAYNAATAAATSALNAATAEANAAAASGAAMWVSDTTYALGAAAWSPIDRLVYRRIIAGAGVTDPSLDATNWASMGVIPQPPAPAGANIFLATTFGAL